MGKNAQARRRRRREHQRTTRRQGARRDPSPFRAPRDTPRADERERAAQLWQYAVAMVGVDERSVPRMAGELSELPAPVVDAEAMRLLRSWVDATWRNGWQPAEVRREARRRTTASATRLLELAVQVDHDRRPGQPIDPRWAAQLREFGQRTTSTQGNWLRTWREGEGFDRERAHRDVLALARAIARMPILDTLIPPPGADPSSVTVTAPAADVADHPMLARVRKLLAKAEATEFEEEAATFTAKAQELMTRHAIDEASVAQRGGSHGPGMIRVPVDAPYADAKSALLHEVARANRCRAAYFPQVLMSSVAGHADDLAVVQMLFTSLLVQAQNALAELGRLGERTRHQSFRASFHLAYAGRIGERLNAVNEQVIADDGGSALPVLRARETQVEEFFDDHYGDSLKAGSVRGAHDGTGFALGRKAADEAKLDAGRIER